MCGVLSSFFVYPTQDGAWAQWLLFHINWPFSPVVLRLPSAMTAGINTDIVTGMPFLYPPVIHSEISLVHKESGQSWPAQSYPRTRTCPTLVNCLIGRRAASSGFPQAIFSRSPTESPPALEMKALMMYLLISLKRNLSTGKYFHSSIISHVIRFNVCEGKSCYQPRIKAGLKHTHKSATELAEI